MRIEVFGESPVSRQARTYAEYRIFAALTQRSNAARDRGVRVLLRPMNGVGEATVCDVTMALDGSDAVRIRATGAHVYEAINRAVERLEAEASMAHEVR